MTTSEGQQRPAPTSRDWWTLTEWADRYGFSINGARAMAARGEIPGCRKFGRRWRISQRAFLKAFDGEAAQAS